LIRSGCTRVESWRGVGYARCCVAGLVGRGKGVGGIGVVVAAPVAAAGWFGGPRQPEVATSHRCCPGDSQRESGKRVFDDTVIDMTGCVIISVLFGRYKGRSLP
ncbi:unnamed protein product, partial [Ectocarpus sp. 12 AP-2014]